MFYRKMNLLCLLDCVLLKILEYIEIVIVGSELNLLLFE